jgi:hypothetical protein
VIELDHTIHYCKYSQASKAKGSHETELDIEIESKPP